MYFLKPPFIETGFRDFYSSYLRTNFRGPLSYLENTAKFDPSQILENTKCIAVFAYPYVNSFIENTLKNAKYRIARYAWGRDYHKILKNSLKGITEGLSKTGNIRIVCDTTPLPERYLAAKCGAGFIGKNGMLIHPQHGSYFLLAFALFDFDVELPSAPRSILMPEAPKTLDGEFHNGQAHESPEAPKTPDGEFHNGRPSQKFGDFNECGECRKCIDACPGQALDGRGLVNTNRCYSFWSIESKAEIIQYSGAPSKKHNWIFGCDICQEVCPYNTPSNGTDSNEANEFYPRLVSVALSRGEIPENENELNGMSFKRTGLNGLLRNKQFIDSL